MDVSERLSRLGTGRQDSLSFKPLHMEGIPKLIFKMNC